MANNAVDIEWTYEVPGKALMAFVKELNVTNEDARFDLLENGITVRAVDPSHVLMSQITIGEGEPTGQSYGMELRRLKVALTGHTKMNSKETSMVTLSVEPNENKMSMDLQNGTMFTWRGLDPETLNTPTLPELKMTSVIKVPSVKLALGVQSQRRIGDLANLIIRKGELEMSVIGSTSRVEVMIPGDGGPTGEIGAKGDTKSSFSLTHMIPIFKEWKNAGTVELSCGDNYPLQAKKTNEIGGVKLESSFFLAPRIDNEY
jgi:DNA polymerase III sliding clamp (beta) subunit (PCNA family)